MIDPRVDNLGKEINQVERAVKIVGRKLDSVTSDVTRLEKKVHRDQSTVIHTIKKRNALNGHSRESLLRYKKELEHLAFAAADFYFERGGRLKRTACELSEQIGIMKERASLHQKQVHVLGDKATGLSAYVDNLVVKAQSLQAQAQRLLSERIPNVEREVTSLWRQAKEES